MEIKTSLSEKEYISLAFLIAYRRPGTRFITLLGILFFGLAIYMQVEEGTRDRLNSAWITPILAFIILPLTIYLSAKRQFSSNKVVREVTRYRFLPEQLEIEGESFKSSRAWSTIFKVTRTKNWLLIWHNRQMANPIQLSTIWEGDLLGLKEILAKHDIKNNL